MGNNIKNNGNNKNDIRNKRRAGFYWINDKPYVSVTTVLSVIDKPALRYWFGKEVYYAMAKDPTLNEQAALSAPYQKNKSAKDRGSTIHSIVESYKHTKEYIKNVPDQYTGYAKAFYKWIEDNDIEIIDHEKTIKSEEYGYAGTLDLLVKNKQSNNIYIVDVKTGKDIYPEAYIQLSAYWQAFKEDKIEVNGIAVLLLNEDSSFKYADGKDIFHVFLATKVLWEWKNEDIIKKMEYK